METRKLYYFIKYYSKFKKDSNRLQLDTIYEIKSLFTDSKLTFAFLDINLKRLKLSSTSVVLNLI